MSRCVLYQPKFPWCLGLSNQTILSNAIGVANHEFGSRINQISIPAAAQVSNETDITRKVGRSPTTYFVSNIAIVIGWNSLTSSPQQPRADPHVLTCRRRRSLQVVHDSLFSDLQDIVLLDLSLTHLLMRTIVSIVFLYFRQNIKLMFHLQRAYNG